jgi:hypothetical protein
LRISTAAIDNAREGATLKVQVLNADGRLEDRTITIGIKSELTAEVTAGLNENDRVVIRAIAPQGSTKSALSVRKGP